MRIVCVGGGPAGLYFAICAKLRIPDCDVTVLERDPTGPARSTAATEPGAPIPETTGDGRPTRGWGVVYWEPFIDILYRADPVSARQIHEASTLWQEQHLTVGERTAYMPGYGYSIQRSTLLDLLTRRAGELGARIRDRDEVSDATDLVALGADADLVVGADGVHSRVRRLAGPAAFGTEVQAGANPYIWLGTNARFSSFVFAFEPTPHGWIWIHAYPSAAAIGTCIVECAPSTWSGLGLDTLGDTAALTMLEEIFARPLGGHRLLSGGPGTPAPRWQRFEHVHNRTWCHDNVVLIGDAAHTTHFTLGSGTALAIMDAMMLVRYLHSHDGDVPGALREFDTSGHALIDALQDRARTSMAWFEQVGDVLERDQDPVAFACAMASRQGTHRTPPLVRQFVRASQRPTVRALYREANSGTRWLLDRRRSRDLARAAA